MKPSSPRTHRPRRAPSPSAARPMPTEKLGPKGGIPVVFFVHLAATLDNWDPRIVDAIAKHRHVITFDQRGVGASTGKIAGTIEEAADHAYEFVTALGLSTIDGFGFSMGGF